MGDVSTREPALDMPPVVDEPARPPVDRWAWLRSRLPGPGLTFGLVLLGTVLTRIFRLGDPDKALIFDELYYVNAARRILGWAVPAEDPYADAPAGLDPNSEHPPLGKVILAGSMKLFGDDPLGWRLPNIVAGVVVVAAVYLLARSVTTDPWLPVYAATVVSLDNLLLVNSRIGTLDVLFLAPLLVGAVLVLRRQWLWAGAACGLAVVIKIPAGFGLLALVVFVLLAPDGGRLVVRLRNACLLGGAAAVVATATMWVLDVRFTNFDHPVEHARHITSYGFDLSRTGGPVNSEADPWQWLSNDTELVYLRVDQNEMVGDEVLTSQPRVWFRGALNPALVGVAVVGLSYAGWRAVRRRDPLALWSVVWAAGIFLPFFVLELVSDRISYLFYALPLVPAYAVAATLLLWHEGLPRAPRWGFLLAMVLGFAAYFPFRTLG
jgi:predicted membrane-bound dolichyl-phosphate-mannose-protein mannosyltransferase